MASPLNEAWLRAEPLHNAARLAGTCCRARRIRGRARLALSKVLLRARDLLIGRRDALLSHE